MAKIIKLSNAAYIVIEKNGSHSVHKAARQGGELFCGFAPKIGNTEPLERALRYVCANKSETAKALKHF